MPTQRERDDGEQRRSKLERESTTTAVVFPAAGEWASKGCMAVSAWMSAWVQLWNVNLQQYPACQLCQKNSSISPPCCDAARQTLHPPHSIPFIQENVDLLTPALRQWRSHPGPTHSVTSHLLVSSHTANLSRGLPLHSVLSENTLASFIQFTLSHPFTMNNDPPRLFTSQY